MAKGTLTTPESLGTIRYVDVQRIVIEYVYDTVTGEFQMQEVRVHGVEGDISGGMYTVLRSGQTGRTRAQLPAAFVTDMEALKDKALQDYMNQRLLTGDVE